MKIILKSKQSVYLEIYSEIKKYILLGVLEKDEKLPSVRDLAKDLGINPNTVARAYGELEKDGFIVLLPKKGAFVTEIAHKNEGALPLSEVKSLKQNGITKENLLRAIETIYGEDEE